MEERAYFWLGYVLIAVVVFLPLLLAMKNVAEGSSFYEEYSAYDLALATNSILALKGDVSLYYNLDSKSDYLKVKFSKDCGFVVSMKEDSFDNEKLKYCVGADLESVDFEVVNKNELVIQKEGGRLYVSGE